MITFPKIKAASYAIGKRLQGYHLLRNPAGTLQTEVNMVKNWYHPSYYWDDMFQIKRIKKTFTKEGSQKQTKNLFSRHFFDAEQMQITKPRKKNLFYSVENNNKQVKKKKSCDMSPKAVEKRKMPNIKNDIEFDKMCDSKIEAQKNRGYYKREYTLLNKIITFGLYKKIMSPPENRPNFFKVLFQNLNNK